MILTEAFLMAHRSKRGGWTYAQIAALGEVVPMRKGWKRRLIGKEISQQAAEQFSSLAGKKQTIKHDG